MIKGSTFGDEVVFPAIKSLANIFNDMIAQEIPCRNQFKYCASTIQEFNIKMRSLNGLPKTERKYFIELLRKDFLERMKDSNLPPLILSHMQNIINGYRNQEIRTKITRK